VTILVASLLSKGANVKIQNLVGCTPLYEVCKTGTMAVLELMLEHDSSAIDVVAANGKSPLHIACKKGYVSIVEALLAKGATSKTVDLKGRTPLKEACENRYKNNLVLTLLKNYHELPEPTKFGIKMQNCILADEADPSQFDKICASYKGKKKGETNKTMANVIRANLQKKLEVIDLSGSDLLHFPISLFALQHLTAINLSKNCISYIPYDISGLQNLTSLDLSNNKLNILPVDALRKLPELQKIYIKDNPAARFMSMGSLESGNATAILNFLDKFQSCHSIL